MRGTLARGSGPTSRSPQPPGHASRLRRIAMMAFWAMTLGLFLVWLLAATGVFSAGPWIHLVLVIVVAFVATGLLWRPSRR